MIFRQAAMRRHSLVVALISASFGTAFGAWIAGGSQAAKEIGHTSAGSASGDIHVAGAGLSAGSPAAEITANASPSASCIPAPSAVVDDLILKVNASPSGSALGSAAFARLLDVAHSSPEMLRYIGNRYATTIDKNEKSMLASVLSSAPSQAATDLALGLAQGDPGQRKDGYELLARQPNPDARVFPAIKQALDTEQDPAVLAQVLIALKPNQVVDPSQTQATLTRLSALAQSTDPMVRSESLKALAQWDKKGEVAEEATYKALVDPNPALRGDALSAIANSQFRSERVKTALVGILGNAAETPETQRMALNAVQRYALTEAEYTIYSQVDALTKQERSAGGERTALSSEGGAALNPFAGAQK